MHAGEMQRLKIDVLEPVLAKLVSEVCKETERLTRTWCDAHGVTHTV